MSSGFPAVRAGEKAPTFAAMDRACEDPRFRWEALKLLRLLEWLWTGVADVTTDPPNAAAAQWIEDNLDFTGPLGHPYAHLLDHPRLSRVWEMLGLSSFYPGHVAHVDSDWFSDTGALRFDLPPGTSDPPKRERDMTRSMVVVLALSLGLNSAAMAGLATWDWPALRQFINAANIIGDPDDIAAAAAAVANGAALETEEQRLQKLMRGDLVIEELTNNLPIDWYWQTGVDSFGVPVVPHGKRILFLVQTPNWL
jgi:hypothetical protein